MESWSWGLPHIFVPILISCQMNSAERPPTNLVSNGILVDLMVGSPVRFIVGVLEPGIEGFLSRVSCPITSLTLGGRGHALTSRWADGVRLWCLMGL